MQKLNKNKLSKAMQLLGYEFQNEDLIISALTHRSVGGLHNERLEFLGDAILNFVIASLLYQRFPKAREGELTRMRARLVRKETLAEVAQHLNFSEYLQLGPGELKAGGQLRNSILADALEAIIGAIYLDGNLAAVSLRIGAWFESPLANMKADIADKDDKTRLQEYCQARHLPLPLYEIIGMKGESHQPLFTIECSIGDLKKKTQGQGNSRRQAEQAAAKAMLNQLQVKQHEGNDEADTA